jgi:two-component system, OmpR family, aerobic respiration control protein ArcA
LKKKLNARDLVAKIERISKERMARADVVDLQSLRRITHKVQSPTILVIEDDDSVRAALRRMLESDGYRVLAAADGTQLSEVLDDAPLALILMDVGLPWIDGFELAALLKEHADLKNIPLVFLSGRDSAEDVKKGFAVGADDYLTKPFDLEKIRKTVRTLIALNKEGL